MCVKWRWILLIYILNIHLKSIAPQYHHHHHHHQNMPREYYEEDDPLDYEDMSDYARRKSKRRSNHDSNECVCSCDRCKKPKPCCVDICNYNCPPQGLNLPVADTPDDNNRVVFVPYPYPLVVNPGLSFKNDSSATTVNPSSIWYIRMETEITTTATIKTTEKPADTTPTTTTTTTATTKSSTTEASTAIPRQVLRGERRTGVEELISGHRNMKELNPSSKRKIKPAWIPKYGIVPIPDHLAAKLMTQLSEVRALKSRRH